MGDLIYKNLDISSTYSELKQTADKADLKTDLTPDRVTEYQILTGGGLTYNYAAKRVNESIIGKLAKLAKEQKLIEKYGALASGEIMNTGECRMVLHHLLRDQTGRDVFHGEKNIGEFYRNQLKEIQDFTNKVHEKRLRGATGKPFNTVVQIGIGGSDLGPRALYLALKNHAGEANSEKMKAFFISNVDPDDANDVLSQIGNLESTMFILVSKSGNTPETLANYELIKKKLKEKHIYDPKQHFVAVTSKTSELAKSCDFAMKFYMDDFIGGRYSSTSSVGGLVLSLAFGYPYFKELLKGAYKADVNAQIPDIRKNAAMMDALIGVYERNILGMPATAILPYSQALVRFPAHLQQLDMESNGKRVNRDGDPICYSTGPVIFGEPGTNGQHSFYQLLHQGTDVIPLQFIGFKNAQTVFDVHTPGSNNQQKLLANLAAQITAFAKGKTDKNPNKTFPGNRPSSLIYGERLTPAAMGALLAHFENKVMFQGFLWNINSFDQEGVQLGKTLAGQVLSGGPTDPVLKAYASLLQ